MALVTIKPNATVQQGNWTVIGATAVHTALSDPSDTSRLEASGSITLDSQVAKVKFETPSIPTGAKIFSVRIKIRVEKTTSTICIPRFMFRQAINISIEGTTISVKVKTLQLQLAPVSTTTGFTDIDLAYYTEKPGGGEWTLSALADLEIHIGLFNNCGGKIPRCDGEVDYNERPVVTAIGPTGSITDNTRPTITFTYSDPENDLQEAYEVKVFTQAQYEAAGFNPLTSTALWTSGQVLSDALQQQVGIDLPNGTYRAYVRARQVWPGVGQHWSEFDSTEWTQAVPGPPAPTLQATIDDVLTRVRLDVGKGGETPATEDFKIEFSDDAGATWALIRNGEVEADVNGTAFVYDYEAPPNIERSYRALAYRTLGTLKISSDYSPTRGATLEITKWRLVDPLDPVGNMILPVVEQRPRIERAQGVFRPLGLNTKLVVEGDRYGQDAVLDLVFVDDQVWDSFERLVSVGRTLLLQAPHAEQHYIRFGNDLEWRYLLIDQTVHVRRAQISYVEVARPS